MTLFNGWVVKKANPDTERLHLNKILQDIDATVLKSANMDGGRADSVYGGTFAVDGGSA